MLYQKYNAKGKAKRKSNMKCKPTYDPKQMKWICSKCKTPLKSVAEVRECNDITSLFGGLFKK